MAGWQAPRGHILESAEIIGDQDFNRHTNTWLVGDSRFAACSPYHVWKEISHYALTGETTMTNPAISFHQADGPESIYSLRDALSGVMNSLSSLVYPRAGLILKYKQGPDGEEELVNWSLVDMDHIERIAIGLSLTTDNRNKESE